jgi:hypothetical protein
VKEQAVKKTILLISIFLSFSSFKVSAMEKNTLFFSIEFPFGAKGTAVGLAFKYFFVDDIGVELQFRGNDISYSEWGYKICYYPSFFNGYGYLNLGLSFGSFHDNVEKDENVYDGKCKVRTLNASAGINPKKFKLPTPTSEEEEGEPKKPYFIVYFESGLAKILTSEVKEVYGIIIEDDTAYENSKSEYKSKTFSNGWLFPDMEFGYGVDLIPKEEE